MGEGEGSRAEAEESHLDGRAQEDRSGAESAVGEGEERSLKDPDKKTRAGAAMPLPWSHPYFFCPCTTDSPLLNLHTQTPFPTCGFSKSRRGPCSPSCWSSEVAMS